MVDRTNPGIRESLALDNRFDIREWTDHRGFSSMAGKIAVRLDLRIIAVGRSPLVAGWIIRVGVQ
ncbi:hypothetical protein BZL43_08305 [Pseudomonas sp. PICF141]|nr:hypothetical protein BZL43_08305 [Pseudomonas sp. PICF141]